MWQRKNKSKPVNFTIITSDEEVERFLSNVLAWGNLKDSALTKDDKSNARTRCPTMHCGLAIIQGRTKQLALWQESCQELATRDWRGSSRLLTPLTFLIRSTHPCLWAIVNIQMTCRASFVKKYLLTKYCLDPLAVWRAMSEAKPGAGKLPISGNLWFETRAAKRNKRPLKTYLQLGSAAGNLIYFWWKSVSTSALHISPVHRDWAA